MKTLTLPVHKQQTPQEMLALLAKENLRSGDKLDIIISEEEQHLLMVALLLLLLAVALLAHFGEKQQQEKRIADGAHMLQDLFSQTDSEEIEKKLEAEYGIEIEFIRAGDEEAEKADWRRLGMQAFAASYGDDEPDYSDALLLEHNPDYKPS